ncbi:aminoglycoside phosphotransferase family protein [Guptibacillus algicola]|uniref:aminoglycoside phosphotransferase family protein n=1 Tax=Guptibacillus algicola TaxID=225844 RepID=UPI001CD29819|nr:aminoglycoside phosphotransferase family protein [Alkalihalobacillus algicola]MCA0987395.1 aminoglycoside phosphotransferase family protein [Alkalihalobacillus algicola]
MKLTSPIAEGNTANIYLRDNQVIKVFKGYLPHTEAVYEAEKQKHAYSRGLPVPKVIDVTKINGQHAIIMEYIKGKTLGELVLESSEKIDDYMRLSVDIQLSIHSKTTNSLEPMTEKLKRQLETAPLLEKKHKRSLVDKLGRMEVGNRLCHGDYHLFNLIKSDDGVIILDWVDSSIGNPRADVYRTYLLYAGYSKEWADRYMKLYCERSGFSMDEVFEWAPIIAGARLSENVSSEDNERLMEIVDRYCVK